MDVTVRSVGYEPVDPSVRLTFNSQRLVGDDFRGRKLKSFSSVGSYFERVDFSAISVESCSFGDGMLQSVYVDCKFDGSRLDMMAGGHARFVRCSFENTVISHWLCYTVELIDCVFSGRLRQIIFRGSVPESDRPFAGRAANEFHGNDFSQAKFAAVSFRDGIDLTRQKLPEGPSFIFVGNARDAIPRALCVSRDSKHRETGLSHYLAPYETNVQQGQEQVLINLRDFPEGSRNLLREILRDTSR